jgi:hypothetical protein
MKCKCFYHLVFIFLILLSSCDLLRIPAALKKDFTICYSGENTGLDTIINLHGYYRTLEERDRFGENHNTLHIIDTFYSNFMFFPDGVHLGLFSSRSKDLTPFFNEANECINSKGDNCSFFSYHYWGYNCVKGDTIIAQHINHVRSLNQFYSGEEIKYKIIDKNTLYIISWRRLGLDESNQDATSFNMAIEDDKFFQAFGRERTTSATAEFIWLDVVPSSECWLKKRRFNFCD